MGFIPSGTDGNFLLFSGIRQLQLMLLKISLIVGVEVHVNVEFAKLLEPPKDQGTDGNWQIMTSSFEDYIYCPQYTLTDLRHVDHPGIIII